MENARPFGLTKALYSIAEASEILSIGKTTTYSLIRTGRIPVVKIGRKSVVPATGIAAFLASLPPAPFIASVDDEAAGKLSPKVGAAL